MLNLRHVVRALPRAGVAIRNYAAKDIRFALEARQPLLRGVDKLANAVAVTLGPGVCLSFRLPIYDCYMWMYVIMYYTSVT